jgi:hypothetical protein
LFFASGLFFLFANIALGVFESTRFDNYIFSTFHFDYPTLIPISMVLLAFGAISAPFSFLKKRQNILIFLLGIIGILYGVAYWFYPLDFFFEIVKEGRSVETIQFFTLIATFILSLAALLKTKKTTLPLNLKVLYVSIFFAIAATCFLLAGEEVAWGEHWFGFQFESLQADNLQNESTLHNKDVFAQYIFQAYMIVSLYGATSWMIPKIAGKKLDKIFFAFTEWQTVPYFGLVLAYQLQQKYFDLGEYFKLVAEYTEMMLYFGFFWIAVRNLNKIRSLKNMDIK